MVKNKNGGNRHKKMARKNVRTTFNKRVRKAKDADEIYAKVSGTWKEVDEAYGKVSGVWKLVFSAFEEDRIMRKDIVSMLDVFRVNEEDIRERAKALIKNINPNDLQYEVELQKKMVEVRRKEGLLKE